MTRSTEKEPFPPRWAFFVAALMIIAGIGWNIYMQYSATQDKNTAQANSQTLAQDIQTICKAQGKLLLDDRDLCAKADKVQDNPTEEIPPAKGEPGRPPTAEEIRAVVTEYCSDGKCQGADGRTPSPADVAKAVADYCSSGVCTGARGQDAPDVTAVQLASAVAEYCSAGVCVGPAGQGGPPPTNEQISAAVADYCQTGACTGPAGADSTVPGPAGADSTVPGPPGPAGADGRSITDAQCLDNGRWSISWSDGTTTDGGQCRETITPPIGAP
jgi:hypothetical protein